MFYLFLVHVSGADGPQFWQTVNLPKHEHDEDVPTSKSFADGPHTRLMRKRVWHHAESEFEKYRIVQDRLFESDFDRLLKQIETPRKHSLR